MSFVISLYKIVLTETFNSIGNINMLVTVICTLPNSKKSFTNSTQLKCLAAIKVRIFRKNSYISCNKCFQYLKPLVLNRKKNALLPWAKWSNYSIKSNSNKTSLPLFNLMFHFYTPWKLKKTSGFLTFSEGIEIEHRAKMDQESQLSVMIESRSENYWYLFNNNHLLVKRLYYDSWPFWKAIK